MSKVDRWANIILLVSVAVYLSVWIVGFLRHKLLPYFSILNAVCGLVIITYWLQKEMRITQHTIELREIAFLSMEALIVAVSIYSFSTTRFRHSLKIGQFMIFGLHFTSLILLLVFMLTFKINKLI